MRVRAHIVIKAGVPLRGAHECDREGVIDNGSDTIDFTERHVARLAPTSKMAGPFYPGEYIIKRVEVVNVG
jgi:hypothetical protein